MVTIYRAQGLRIVIFTDDHPPAHVHVFGDGQAKINLIGPDGEPELIWAEGMKRNEVRRDGGGDRTAGRVARTLERDTWLN